MVSPADRNTESSTAALDAGQGTAGRNPEMLRSTEAALYIDMSNSWLRQTRMAGRMDGPPFLRQGRAIRYRRCDLDRWLERRLCGGDVQSAQGPLPPTTKPKHQRPPRPKPKRGRGQAAR